MPNFTNPAVAEVTKVARANGNRTCVAYASHSCTESTNGGFYRDPFTSLTAYACQILQTFPFSFAYASSLFSHHCLAILKPCQTHQSHMLSGLTSSQSLDHLQRVVEMVRDKRRSICPRLCFSLHPLSSGENRSIRIHKHKYQYTQALEASSSKLHE